MTKGDALISALADSAVFAQLPRETLHVIAAAMRPATFPAGQMVFGRGEPGRELYVVLDGRVKVSILSADGRELAFAHIHPGSLFGEIAMLDGGPRTADATALTKVEAMSLGMTALQDLMARSPQFAQAIITFLCGRLRETNMQLESVALHRIEVRLARYLEALCRQAAPKTTTGAVDVQLAISQGEMALLLGASRPKVNGALSLLEAEGVIERVGDRIRCNLEELRAVAEIE